VIILFEILCAILAVVNHNDRSRYLQRLSVLKIVGTKMVYPVTVLILYIVVLVICNFLPILGANIMSDSSSSPSSSSFTITCSSRSP
ncbi:hypothetical protein M405DRAFT_628927, partial [Rhizopogon salebrosus TDB-379]